MSLLISLDRAGHISELDVLDVQDRRATAEADFPDKLTTTDNKNRHRQFAIGIRLEKSYEKIAIFELHWSKKLRPFL